MRSDALAMIGWMALLGGVVVGPAGCSSAQATDFDAAGPYAPEFRQLYEASDSDYVRTMLADGKVDVAELREAQQHVVECMADAGYAVEFVPDGYGFENESVAISHAPWRDFTDDEVAAMNAADAQCNRRWLGLADTLYWYTQTNPHREDWDSLVAACLVRHGMVAEGFTGQDYVELMASADDSMDAAGPYLPGGRGLGEPEGRQCEAMPLQ